MSSLDRLGPLFEQAYTQGCKVYSSPERLAEFYRAERGKLPMRVVSEAADISVRSLMNVESAHASHKAMKKVSDVLGYEMVVLMIKRK